MRFLLVFSLLLLQNTMFAQGFDIDDVLLIEGSHKEEKITIKRYNSAIQELLDTRVIDLDKIVFEGYGEGKLFDHFQILHENQAVYFIGCYRGDNSIDGDEGYSESCYVQSLFKYDWLSNTIRKEIDLVKSYSESDRILFWKIADANTAYLLLRNVIHRVDLNTQESKDVFDINFIENVYSYDLKVNKDNDEYFITVPLLVNSFIDGNENNVHMIVVYSSKDKEVRLHSIGTFEDNVDLVYYDNDHFLFERTTNEGSINNEYYKEIFNLDSQEKHSYRLPDIYSNYQYGDAGSVIVNNKNELWSLNENLDEINTYKDVNDSYLEYVDQKSVILRIPNSTLKILDRDLKYKNSVKLEDGGYLMQVVRIE